MSSRIPNPRFKNMPKAKRLDVERALQERGFDIIDEILILYRDETTTNKDRLECCKALLRYCAPTLKAVTLEDKRQGALNCNVTFDNSASGIGKEILGDFIESSE